MVDNYLDKNRKMLKAFGKENLVKDTYFKIESTKDGNMTFEYEKDNKSIHINSSYNINNEVNQLLKDINFENDHLFIVYGIGLGYHINEIIKKSTKRSRIFIMETDEYILNTYIRNKDLMDFNDNRIVLFMGSEQEIIADFNSHIFSYEILPLSTSIIPIIMPAYYYIYGESLNNFNKRILDLFRHSMFNLGNDIDDTVIGLRQNFENLKELVKSPSIELVKNKYINKPAIIVGAGPSLDKNIKYLKEAEGKALILATDAVISTLQKYDIVPDAIFSIERGIETYDAFYKNNGINEKIVFIGPPVVSSLILEKIDKNKKLLCLKEGEKINEWINDKILNENRLFKMGTSCAHVAFGFSKYIGSNPIVFIGQDLAYTKDGVTHAEEVEIKMKVENSKCNEQTNVAYVQGIDGEMLPTSYAYKNFLTFLEIEIANDKSNRLYIDATEGGAFKNGTKIMTLKEVIKQYCENKIVRLYDLLPENCELDNFKFSKGKEELIKLGQEFDKLENECSILLEKVKRFEKRVMQGTHYNKILKEVSSKQSDIENIIINHDVIRTFFQGLLINSNMKEIAAGNNKNIETIKQKIQIYKSFAGNLSIGCKYCSNAVDEIKERLESEEK